MTRIASTPISAPRRAAALRTFALGALALALGAIAAPGSAAAIEVQGFGPEALLYAAVANPSVPTCGESAVLDTIHSKLGTADAAILKQNLSIAGLDKIRETYAGSNDPSPQFRRYCEADAHLNNGKKTTLYYLVEQGAGYVGLAWNVEFCLLGLEPWRHHDGRCHTVRHRWW